MLDLSESGCILPADLERGVVRLNKGGGLGACVMVILEEALQKERRLGPPRLRH